MNNEFPASNITLKMTGPALSALLAADPTLSIQMGQQVCEQFAKRYLQSIDNQPVFATLKKDIALELNKVVESIVGTLKFGYYGNPTNPESISIKPELLALAKAQLEVACKTKVQEMVDSAIKNVIDNKLKALVDYYVEQRVTEEIRSRVKTKVEAILKDVMNGKLDEVIKTK